MAHLGLLQGVVLRRGRLGAQDTAHVLALGAELFAIWQATQQVLVADPAAVPMYQCQEDAGIPVSRKRGFTYISPVMTCMGLEECLAERPSRSSVAKRASLTITKVCPIVVMELMGPVPDRDGQFLGHKKKTKKTSATTSMLRSRRGPLGILADTGNVLCTDHRVPCVSASVEPRTRPASVNRSRCR